MSTNECKLRSLNVTRQLVRAQVRSQQATRLIVYALMFHSCHMRANDPAMGVGASVFAAATTVAASLARHGGSGGGELHAGKFIRGRSPFGTPLVEFKSCNALTVEIGGASASRKERASLIAHTLSADDDLVSQLTCLSRSVVLYRSFISALAFRYTGIVRTCLL